MDSAFWQARWREGRIGFHQEQPTPSLLAHWPALALPAGSRVFVPLAGKTVDMAWLAAQGYRVLGVELSQIAVDAFFNEHGLQPEHRASKYGIHHVAGNIELICGDVFAFDRNALRDCVAIFDRAALIALPPDMQLRYVSELCSRLPIGCRGLLITLEYPQHQKNGPPFSINADAVRALYAADWRVDTLDRQDILASQLAFQAEGVTRLQTVAYRIQKRSP